MKEIELTQGQVAIVDDEDYEYLSQWKWYAQYDYIGKRYYAKRSIKGGGIRMHRFIMKSPDGFEVDHINRNSLDNRKENLRIATRQQNNCNRVMKNSSGYKGVKKAGERFVAQINNGKKIHIGTYATAEEAAKAYDKKAVEFFGEFCKTNF